MPKKVHGNKALKTSVIQPNQLTPFPIILYTDTGILSIALQQKAPILFGK